MTGKKLNKVLAFALAIVLSVGLLPTQASAATVTFTDVPTGAWYYADVTRLANAGIIDGVGNNRFAPESNISYAEMVKLIINSCFRAEYAAYEAQHSAEMQAHFANQKYWFSFMCYYAKQIGLLNGPSTLKPVIMDIDNYASCTTPMTRYDMAQILTNALKLKGIEATAVEKESAAKKITDYVPVQYQNAVQNCFALQTQNAAGETKFLLEGNNGYFNGENNMTRAQACAVIVRLENLIINGGSATEPTTPAPATGKEIQVSNEFMSGSTSAGSISGNAWTVGDNGFGDGYLNNGKPITEDNVRELLRQAEAIWTQDTKWSENGSGNNFYRSSGSVVSAMMKTPNTGARTNLNTNVGCGGFAAMISDYIFGRDNNNFHKVSDISQIRPGDIIIRVDKKTNEPVHAFVAVSTPGGTYTSTEDWTTTSSRAGYIHITNGNSSDKIKWPTEYSAPIGYVGNEAATYNWLIYSRYPNSGTSGTPNSTTTPSQSTAPAEREITVTTSNESDGTIAFTVTDNGFATGYLNNGKEINEANVTELLLKAKEIWPTGMSWGYGTETGTHRYKNIGYIIGGVIQRNTACSGYAAMLSDYLFGKIHNPVRQVTNFADLRPGDIIISQTRDHVVVVVGKVTSGTRAGAVYVTEGNNSLKVKWANNGTKEWPDSGLSQYYAQMESDFGDYVAYTRYPA